MVDHTHQDIDAATGTATTGHEWDGIKELNTPLPKWWLYVMYACMIWAVGYWFLYPAIPLPGGRTRLEGTTWYRHHIWPADYWRIWSDWILHSIHQRVLQHVKRLSEQPSRSA